MKTCSSIRRIRSLSRGAVIAVLLLAATGSAAPAQTTLSITGSSTMAPLVADIGKRFEELHPDIRVDVQAGGSSRGTRDVRSGMAAIGMISRAPAADEADLGAFLVAIDGIGIIVHGDNPVAELTDAQIVALFTGQVRNWRDVGGPDLPVAVVNKSEGRSTLELFLAHFRLGNRQIRADVVIGDNQQGIKTVSANPGAVGYVSIGTAEREILEGASIRLLPLGGVAATVENVRRGRFPLARPLHLVTQGAPAGTTLAFIEFARSGVVDDLVAEHFFVPRPR
jgi:phosphate transport system substrate-binding protein